MILTNFALKSLGVYSSPLILIWLVSTMELVNGKACR
jgi:hypothetical protein